MYVPQSYDKFSFRPLSKNSHVCTLKEQDSHSDFNSDFKILDLILNQNENLDPLKCNHENSLTRDENKIYHNFVVRTGKVWTTFHQRDL